MPAPRVSFEFFPPQSLEASFRLWESLQVLAPLKPLYDAYSFQVLPRLGRLVAGDADSYRYLAESIRRHPDQDTLLGMLHLAGFGRCQYFNLTGGIVAVHRGYRL